MKILATLLCGIALSGFVLAMPEWNFDVVVPRVRVNRRRVRPLSRFATRTSHPRAARPTGGLTGRADRPRIRKRRRRLRLVYSG